MNREVYRELLPLYPLGALDEEDRAAFARFLEQANPEDKKEAAVFNDIALVLAEAVAPVRRPGAHVKSAVMRAIGGEATVEEPAQRPTVSAVSGYTFIDENKGAWRPLPTQGVRIKELSNEPALGYTMFLMDFEPGSEFPHHHHSGAEECYVLSGELITQGRVMHAGDFFHARPDTPHGRSYTETGCRVLLVAARRDYFTGALRFYEAFYKVKKVCLAVWNSLRARFRR